MEEEKGTNQHSNDDQKKGDQNKQATAPSDKPAAK